MSSQYQPKNPGTGNQWLSHGTQWNHQKVIWLCCHLETQGYKDFYCKTYNRSSRNVKLKIDRKNYSKIFLKKLLSFNPQSQTFRFIADFLKSINKYPFILA